MHISTVMNKFSAQARLCARGFSLIELLVVLAIIAIITGTILARYGAFNNTVLLKDLAYEVALAIREAQVIGVSVRGANGTFTDAYGVRFVAGGTSFTQFRDTDSTINGYDSGDEEISTYTIGRNNSIVQVCVNNNCSIGTLDVVFERPEPDAFFFVNNTRSNASSARIIVGGGGNTRTVRIYPTGQISIE